MMPTYAYKSFNFYNFLRRSIIRFQSVDIEACSPPASNGQRQAYYIRINLRPFAFREKWSHVVVSENAYRAETGACGKTVPPGGQIQLVEVLVFSVGVHYLCVMPDVYSEIHSCGDEEFFARIMSAGGDAEF